jgi:DNA-binding MarR family transcriptional regulator
MMADGNTELPPLPCACASLRRAARAVSQLYDDEMRATGLRVTQFTLLQSLMRGGPLMQSELATLLAIDSTTLSRTLRPLERAGWIRAQAGDDKRARNWVITGAGQRQLARAQPAWEAAQRRLRGRLGADRWNALLSELAGIAQAAR